MKKMVFTDTFVKKLKPEESDYSRSEGNGFTIRVMPSGSKTWLYLYAFDGKRRKMNLGQYPDVTLETARDRFDDAKRKVKNGIDPLEEQEQAKQERIHAPTVADLIKEYIKKHAEPNKRGWMEDKRLLKKDALPAWGNLKAKDIKKRDVVLLLEKIVERGSPGSANNNFKVIRKMFRFAVQRDILEHSPCDGVVMPAPLNRGDRVLTEQEIRTFWRNLDICHVSDEIRRALRLVLTTGQRPGEVIGMHTRELDDRWWTIPVERSKNKRAHRVYLTDTAFELITEQIAANKTARKLSDDTTYDGLIFESPASERLKKDGAPRDPQPIAVGSIAHVIRRNTAVPVTDDQGKPLFTAEGKPAVRNLLEVADFTPHDLRRTAATFMSQLGMLDEVIDAVLNHTKQGVIRTYNLNRYDREKQTALESWERKLRQIITGVGKSNVVAIGTAQGTRKAA